MRVTRLGIVSFSALIILSGCPSVTGLTQWKERSLLSAADPDKAFRGAAQALANVGQVKGTDPSLGAVTGECAQDVDASVLVQQRNDGTWVVVKSKMNIPANMMMLDSGQRETCINRISDELRKSGIVR